jgi:hypothetical protein
MFDPAQGEAAARGLLENPATTPEDLAVIAGAFPALLPQVAAHPQLYPGLRDWLASLGRADVDAALAAGAAPAPAPTPAPEPGPAPFAPPEAQPWTPDGYSPSAAEQGPAQGWDTGQTPQVGYGQGQPAPYSASAAETGPPQGWDTGQTPQLGYGQGQADGYSPSAAPPGQTPVGPVPPKKGGKTKLIVLIIAAAVVVALVVGAGWFFFLRKPAAERQWAPDFSSKPKLGKEIDLSKVLAGDIYSSGFTAFLDSDTVIATGEPDYSVASSDSSWYEGYDEDYSAGGKDAAAYQTALDTYESCDDDYWSSDATSYDCVYPSRSDYDDYYDDYSGDHRGYYDGWEGEDKEIKPAPPEGLTVVAAINVDSGKAEWQLDVGKELGLGLARMGCSNGSSVALDGKGGLVLNVSDGAALATASDPGDTDEDSTDDDACTTVAVSSKGSVTSKRQSANGASGIASGVALFFTKDDVTGAKVSDLATDVWSASLGKDADEVSARWIMGGETTLVWTEDGYVDATTGKAAGFGGDADDSDIRYGFYGSGADVLIRTEGLDDEDHERTIMRVSSSSGADQWKSAADVGYCSSEMVGDLIVCDEPGDDPDSVVAIDADTGDTRWTAKASGGFSGVYALASGDVALMPDSETRDTVLVLSAKDGTSKGKIKAPKDKGINTLFLGKSTVYWVANDRLYANSAKGDFGELWNLKIESGSWVGTSFGRIFVEHQSEGSEDGTTTTLREIIAG